MVEEKLVYSIPEASKLLGVSHIHGYLMAKRGQIPTIKLGRRIVVPKSALLRMLENAGDGPRTS